MQLTAAPLGALPVNSIKSVHDATALMERQAVVYEWKR